MRLSLSAPRDIPPGPFTASVPLYPGATPLRHFVALPIWTYPMTPYLQTGVAEYRTKTDVATVESWYRSAFDNCGWRSDGTMSTNASIFDAGLNFASNANPHLEMYMTFGITATGGAYIAYAAEDVTLPPRPAASYLRGPFSEIRIAYSFNDYSHPQTIHHIVHFSVRDRAAIRRFVLAINAITDVLAGTYKGGGITNGPAWLSFVRPDGRVVHVWANVLSLQVNHTRTLHNSPRVWSLITGLVYHQGRARHRVAMMGKAM
jgi:hypothetical protein